MPIAELGVLRGRADLVVLLEETLRVAGVLGPEPVHSPALPLVARLLGYHAHTLWQRGDLDTGERQARRALDVAAAVGEPSAGRDAEEALANVFGFRGDLLAARRHGVLALELAIAAADPDAVAFALSDLALQAAYAGDHDASRPARGAAGRARGAHRVGDRPRLARCTPAASAGPSGATRRRRGTSRRR